MEYGRYSYKSKDRDDKRLNRNEKSRHRRSSSRESRSLSPVSRGRGRGSRRKRDSSENPHYGHSPLYDDGDRYDRRRRSPKGRQSRIPEYEGGAGVLKRRESVREEVVGIDFASTLFQELLKATGAVAGSQEQTAVMSRSRERGDRQQERGRPDEDKGYQNRQSCSSDRPDSSPRGHKRSRSLRDKSSSGDRRSEGEGVNRGDRQGRQQAIQDAGSDYADRYKRSRGWKVNKRQRGGHRISYSRSVSSSSSSSSIQSRGRTRSESSSHSRHLSPDARRLRSLDREYNSRTSGHQEKGSGQRSSQELSVDRKPMKPDELSHSPTYSSICSEDSFEISEPKLSEDLFKEEMYRRLKSELTSDQDPKEREERIAQHIREMAKLSPFLFREFMANNAENLSALALVQSEPDSHLNEGGEEVLEVDVHDSRDSMARQSTLKKGYGSNYPPTPEERVPPSSGSELDKVQLKFHAGKSKLKEKTQAGQTNVRSQYITWQQLTSYSDENDDEVYLYGKKLDIQEGSQSKKHVTDMFENASSAKKETEAKQMHPLGFVSYEEKDKQYKQWRATVFQKYPKSSDQESKKVVGQNISLAEKSSQPIQLSTHTGKDSKQVSGGSKQDVQSASRVRPSKLVSAGGNSTHLGQSGVNRSSPENKELSVIQTSKSSSGTAPCTNKRKHSPGPASPAQMKKLALARDTPLDKNVTSQPERGAAGKEEASGKGKLYRPSPSDSEAATKADALAKHLLERIRKVAAVQNELDALKKIESDWLCKLGQGPDSRKSPVIVENRVFQQQLTKCIQELRSGKDVPIESMLSSASTWKPEELSSEKGNLKDKLKADPSFNRACCLQCQTVCDNAQSYFTHLLSKQHQKKNKCSSQPWQREGLKKYTKDSTLPVIKGEEFLTATVAFYCFLCSEMCSDNKVAIAHLHSMDHHHKYQDYLSRHPSYEKHYKQERAKVLSKPSKVIGDAAAAGSKATEKGRQGDKREDKKEQGNDRRKYRSHSRDRDRSNRHGKRRSRDRHRGSRDRDRRSRNRDGRSRDRHRESRDRDRRSRNRDRRSIHRDRRSRDRDRRSRERGDPRNYRASSKDKNRKENDRSSRQDEGRKSREGSRERDKHDAHKKGAKDESAECNPPRKDSRQRVKESSSSRDHNRTDQGQQDSREHDKDNHCKKTAEKEEEKPSYREEKRELGKKQGGIADKQPSPENEGFLSWRDEIEKQMALMFTGAEGKSDSAKSDKEFEDSGKPSHRQTAEKDKNDSASQAVENNETTDQDKNKDSKMTNQNNKTGIVALTCSVPEMATRTQLLATEPPPGPQVTMCWAHKPPPTEIDSQSSVPQPSTAGVSEPLSSQHPDVSVSPCEFVSPTPVMMAAAPEFVSPMPVPCPDTVMPPPAARSAFSTPPVCFVSHMPGLSSGLASSSTAPSVLDLPCPDGDPPTSSAQSMPPPSAPFCQPHLPAKPVAAGLPLPPSVPEGAPPLPAQPQVLPGEDKLVPVGESGELTPPEAKDEAAPSKENVELACEPPGESAEPIVPGESSEPTASAESSEPIVPGESSEPVPFGESSEPTAPGENSEPTVLGSSSEPIPFGESAEPTASGNNVALSLPGNSVESSLPGDSADSSLPGDSADFSLPGGSADFSLPGGSADSSLPEGSAESSLPGDSAKPTSVSPGECAKSAHDTEYAEPSDVASGESSESALQLLAKSSGDGAEPSGNSAGSPGDGDGPVEVMDGDISEADIPPAEESSVSRGSPSADDRESGFAVVFGDSGPAAFVAESCVSPMEVDSAAAQGLSQQNSVSGEASELRVTTGEGVCERGDVSLDETDTDDSIVLYLDDSFEAGKSEEDRQETVDEPCEGVIEVAMPHVEEGTESAPVENVTEPGVVCVKDSHDDWPVFAHGESSEQTVSCFKKAGKDLSGSDDAHQKEMAEQIQKLAVSCMTEAPVEAPEAAAMELEESSDTAVAPFVEMNDQPEFCCQEAAKSRQASVDKVCEQTVPCPRGFAEPVVTSSEEVESFARRVSSEMSETGVASLEHSVEPLALFSDPKATHKPPNSPLEMLEAGSELREEFVQTAEAQDIKNQIPSSPELWQPASVAVNEIPTETDDSFQQKPTDSQDQGICEPVEDPSHTSLSPPALAMSMEEKDLQTEHHQMEQDMSTITSPSPAHSSVEKGQSMSSQVCGQQSFDVGSLAEAVDMCVGASDRAEPAEVSEDMLTEMDCVMAVASEKETQEAEGGQDMLTERASASAVGSKRGSLEPEVDTEHQTSLIASESAPCNEKPQISTRPPPSPQKKRSPIAQQGLSRRKGVAPPLSPCEDLPESPEAVVRVTRQGRPQPAVKGPPRRQTRSRTYQVHSEESQETEEEGNSELLIELTHPEDSTVDPNTSSGVSVASNLDADKVEDESTRSKTGGDMEKASCSAISSAAADSTLAEDAPPSKRQTRHSRTVAVMPDESQAARAGRGRRGRRTGRITARRSGNLPSKGSGDTEGDPDVAVMAISPQGEEGADVSL